MSKKIIKTLLISTLIVATSISTLAFAKTVKGGNNKNYSASRNYANSYITAGTYSNVPAIQSIRIHQMFRDEDGNYDDRGLASDYKSLGAHDGLYIQCSPNNQTGIYVNYTFDGDDGRWSGAIN